MVKTLGIIFVAIIVSMLTMLVDHAYGSHFLYQFYQTQAITIVATVVALNVATVTFLLGHLVSLEQKANKTLFAKTKGEIRDNVYFMFGSLIAIFFTITATKPSELITINSASFNFMVFVSTILFVLIFICLFEIITAIFKATNFK